MLEVFEADLRELERQGRLRGLRERSGTDFTSNDYLGMAESDELRQAAAAALARGVPVGSGGSRLLRGNHPEHEALEQEAAAYFGAESALYFGGGYVANLAIFSTLPQRGDLVVHDELVHASVHEGLRRGRADVLGVRHNDIDAFEAAIVRWRAGGGKGRPWISVESLYSMDGDSPDLAGLLALADRHEAMAIIDEAHATGVLGPDGRGLAADFEGRDNIITLHTCGKALGTVGGLVLAPPCHPRLSGQSRPPLYLCDRAVAADRRGHARRDRDVPHPPGTPRAARRSGAVRRKRASPPLRHRAVRHPHPADHHRPRPGRGERGGLVASQRFRYPGDPSADRSRRNGALAHRVDHRRR